jgi:excisionase family DNA binding protein
MTERLMTIAEVADYLHVPYTWLRDKVSARAVPHTRIGRHVRFTEEHVRAIVQAGERTPVPPHTTTGVSPFARKRLG